MWTNFSFYAQANTQDIPLESRNRRTCSLCFFAYKRSHVLAKHTCNTYANTRNNDTEKKKKKIRKIKKKQVQEKCIKTNLNSQYNHIEKITTLYVRSTGRNFPSSQRSFDISTSSNQTQESWKAFSSGLFCSKNMFSLLIFFSNIFCLLYLFFSSYSLFFLYISSIFSPHCFLLFYFIFVFCPVFFSVFSHFIRVSLSWLLWVYFSFNSSNFFSLLPSCSF